MTVFHHTAGTASALSLPEAYVIISLTLPGASSLPSLCQGRHHFPHFARGVITSLTLPGASSLPSLCQGRHNFPHFARGVIISLTLPGASLFPSLCQGRHPFPHFALCTNQRGS
ncbi:hypothetical protein ACOMHN_059800 [Nucella lapillus]